MARAKSVKPEEKVAAPKVDVQQITIDKAEFVRTRDALITSWVTLQNALKNATSAYIDHSNAVLGGTVSLDTSQLDLGQFLQAGALVTVNHGAADVKPDEKKPRKKAAPKDPNAPKRPLTAYLLWLGENREKIHADLGSEQKRGQISQEGTARWNQLPEAVKQKYKDAYGVSREVYLKEMESYKTAQGEAADAAAAATSEEADVDMEDVEEAEDEEEDAPAPAAAPTATDAETSSDDDDDDSSDSDSEAPSKEPTPPPVKTPRSALKGGRKKAVEKPAATAPASSPPLPTSSPSKKGAFTTVNSGPTKRKNKTDPVETIAEEPKKKRGRKAAVKEEVQVPASTPVVEPASAKKDKKKKGGRKSVGADA